MDLFSLIRTYLAPHNPSSPTNKLAQYQGAFAIFILACISLLFGFVYFDIVQITSIGALLSNIGPWKAADPLQETLNPYPSHNLRPKPWQTITIEPPSTDSYPSPSPLKGSSSSDTGNGAQKDLKKEEEEEEEDDESDIEVVDRSPYLQIQGDRHQRCNLFVGRWVRDESYPLYASRDCPFIDEGFRCQENGRPDQDYLRWRWQPSGCDMPSFDARDMLKRLQGSRLVFVGDSIGRNQWESMLCMLAQVVPNKTRIYEVNGQPITKHKGFLIFKFQDYNCTVEYYRSPFLVPQGHPPRNSPQGVRISLKVDTMDWSSKYWRGANILVFNAGHWWNYEKTRKGGCYFEVDGQVNKSMKVKEGFTKAMRTWRDWVIKEIDFNKTQVFFRNYAPAHFRGGTWQGGGGCDNETEPLREEAGEEAWQNAVLLREILPGVPVARLLDITGLSAQRPDAHSSLYNQPAPHHNTTRQDCSHWCLPGLPDTWNLLLYASLIS